jgi:hypothetical protein
VYPEWKFAPPQNRRKTAAQIRSSPFRGAILEVDTGGLAMEERDFYNEKPEQRPHTLTCPHCRQAAEYQLNWLVRRKKNSIPPRADERDRARFAKAQSYMVLREDQVACQNIRCRKRFELAGIKSVAFIDA